ncbi:MULTISPECIES: hypothetical protein [unclassified Corynebacterium]|uniref:hypothetical protein n=1 Tax=unclassified Corynebacterium TaxID=2624378 RepID=UPI00298D90C5|nr:MULTISPECIES: hypothetical protein [unclassified Corynebacterium]
MTDFRQWYYDTTGLRLTADRVAAILGMSRTSATRRLTTDDLDADEVIELCRALDLNPLVGLVDLEYITDKEVWGYLDSDGQLVETAEDGDLALELARRLNPATRSDELEELRRRKASTNVTPDFYDDDTPHDDEDLPYVADSSPTEPEPGDDDYSDGP